MFPKHGKICQRTQIFLQIIGHVAVEAARTAFPDSLQLPLVLIPVPSSVYDYTRTLSSTGTSPRFFYHVSVGRLTTAFWHLAKCIRPLSPKLFKGTCCASCAGYSRRRIWRWFWSYPQILHCRRVRSSLFHRIQWCWRFQGVVWL